MNLEEKNDYICFLTRINDDSSFEFKKDSGKNYIKLYFEIIKKQDFLNANTLQDIPLDKIFLLKITTTLRRFLSIIAERDISINNEIIKERQDWPLHQGAWYQLTLEHKKGQPKSFIAELSVDQKSEIKRTNLSQAMYIPAKDDKKEDLALKLINQKKRDINTENQLRERIERISEDILKRKSSDPTSGNIKKSMSQLSLIKVVSLDVGQASCITFIDNENNNIGFFDVGLPLRFNPSAPKELPRLDIHENAFVILSHFDYDHYSWALYNEELMNIKIWIVPEQG